MKDRALFWLMVAGWVALAVPPVLYAGATLALSVGAFGQTRSWTALDGMGMLTALVMLAAVVGGGFKYWRKDAQQGWSLLALAWAPLLMTVIWGLFGRA